MKKAKRTMHVRYTHDRRNEDAERVAALLRENGNDFVLFADSGLSREIYIQKRSGETWDDVMRLVNSVCSVRYRFSNEIIEDGKVYCDCGVICA